MNWPNTFDSFIKKLREKLPEDVRINAQGGMFNTYTVILTGADNRSDAYSVFTDPATGKPAFIRILF